MKIHPAITCAKKAWSRTNVRLARPLLAGGAGLFMVMSSVANAQTAAFNGTLADYFALEEGVLIGDTLFSDFQILPRQTGASGFRSDFIDVIPLFDDPESPGFRFDIMDGATVDDFFELRFSFRITGAVFDSADLSLDTVNVRSDSNAGVDALLAFSEPGSPSNLLGSLVAFAAPGDVGDKMVSADITPSSDMLVEIDTVLDGGGVGQSGQIVASLGSVTSRFNKSAVQPVVRFSISKTGMVDQNTFFIEFTGAPNSPHTVRKSADLEDGFSMVVTPIGGSSMTDATGFGRVEIDISTLGEAHFFRIETSS